MNDESFTPRQQENPTRSEQLLFSVFRVKLGSVVEVVQYTLLLCLRQLQRFYPHVGGDVGRPRDEAMLLVTAACRFATAKVSGNGCTFYLLADRTSHQIWLGFNLVSVLFLVPLRREIRGKGRGRAGAACDACAG